MSVLNCVNDDIYIVLEKCDERHFIINYYNEKLLVKIGSIWKLLEH